jgi:hypothetical protein
MVTVVVVPDLVFVTGSIASTTAFNTMCLYTWQRAGLADQVGPDANAKTRRAVRAVTGSVKPVRYKSERVKYHKQSRSKQYVAHSRP